MNAMNGSGGFKPDDFLIKDETGAAKEAAPGITQHDVEGLKRRRSSETEDYAARVKVYPKLGKGNFRNIKWAVMLVTLGIYYVLPWIRWERGAGLPDQMFLIDFANQRLMFGPVQIWAQEFYYVTGLLIVSALGLFLVTALAGRVWCGYACPQTVWTDLMVAVERFWQGDRNQHMRLDQGPWTFEKVWKKTATHISWLVIALATGGALVFYFRDAPTLALEFLNGTAPSTAYAFLAIFTGTTYLLGGIAREQVCIYMCPWPRIQGAMLDRDSLLVSYRDLRGEPRGAHKKGQTWDGRGDCIDCKACVAVCPMGIDIRNGSQLECIQCALCIDACNDIMDKVGRPRGLIAYTTERNQASRTAGPRDGLKLIRTRTVLYSGLIAFVLGIMLYGLISRSDMGITVQPDRNPLFVRLSDGGIRNAYTVKVANKTLEARKFRIEITGLEGLKVSAAGIDSPEVVVEVSPSDVHALRVFATLPGADARKLASDSTPLRIVATEIESRAQTMASTSFRSPGQ
jgi:cytochrome c oxidase accessory protein FixG